MRTTGITETHQLGLRLLELLQQMHEWMGWILCRCTGYFGSRLFLAFRPGTLIQLHRLAT